MSSLQVNASVWVTTPELKCQRAAVVKDTSKAGVITVQLQGTDTKMDVKPDQIKEMLSFGANGIANMIQLPELHEGALLHNLMLRYNHDDIYTYVGKIVVALNPYKDLPIFSPANARQYRSGNIAELPPHLFATASDSYHSMLKKGMRQCVLISGESGAGKTESTKIVLQYLATLSGKHSLTEERILASSPILEVFGNATTVRNDNSSRFGKFLEIQFKTDGSMAGGRINDFLLEASRVVQQSVNERNYHVFYGLLLTAPDAVKKKLFLGKVSDYRILNGGNRTTVETIDDVDMYQKFKGAFENLGFTTQDEADVERLLAAILHLGNVQFSMSKSDSKTSVATVDVLKTVAELMGVPSDVLTRSLTNKISKTKDETIVSPLDLTQANDVRDSVCKTLYGWMFTWIVKSLNERIQQTGSHSSIGVLDIFGFEDFQKNSFEQFCINYANEKLQHFFNQNIFATEQEQYAKDGVTWDSIKFDDNQACLDLIAKKPLGILHILDEETQFPKGSDASFAEKIKKNHEKHPQYAAAKGNDPVFTVIHYAGKVTYRTEGFLEKNRNQLRQDLEQMCIASKFDFLGNLVTVGMMEDAAKTLSVKSTTTLARPGSVGNAGPTKPKTIGGKFEESLALLVSILSSSEPHFVRCVKPNTEKKPGKFDHEMILAQMRYSGLLATVKIRKLGFPVRKTFSDFMKRYMKLLPPNTGKLSNDKDGVLRIMKSIKQIKEEQYRVGNTMIFYKDEVDDVLDKLREKFYKSSAIVIQKWVRRHLARRLRKRKMKALVTIQRFWRKRHAKVSGKKKGKAVVKIQAVYRGFKARKKYKNILASLKYIQDVLWIRVARARVVHCSKMKEMSKTDAANFSAQDIAQKSADLAAVMAALDTSLKAVFAGPMEAVTIKSLLDKAILTDSTLVSSFTASPIDASCDYEKFIQIYYTSKSVELKPPRQALLSVVPVTLSEVASQCFLSLLALVDPTAYPSQTNPVVHLMSLILKSSKTPPLRDEIFGQLCHIAKEPSFKGSLKIISNLFSILLDYFAPSDQIKRFIASFFDKTFDNTTGPFLRKKLDLATLRPARSNVSPEELLAVLKRSVSLSTEVSYGTQKSKVPVDMLSSCEDLLSALMVQMKIKEYPGWCFVQNGGFALNNSIRVLDLNPGLTQSVLKSNGKMLDLGLMLYKETVDPDEALREPTLMELLYEQVRAELKNINAVVDGEIISMIIGLMSVLDGKPPNVATAVNTIFSENIVSMMGSIVKDIENIVKTAVPELSKMPKANVKPVFIETCTNVPGLFGRCFTADTVRLPNGQSLMKVVGKVDSNGVHFFDTQSKMYMWGMSFNDISEFSQVEESLKLQLDHVAVEIFTEKSAELYAMIHRYRETLVRTSNWCVATGSKLGGDGEVLTYIPGDYIEIFERKEGPDAWWHGRNHTVLEAPEGWFQASNVRVLFGKPKIMTRRSADQTAAIAEKSGADNKSKPGADGSMENFLPLMYQWGLANCRLDDKKVGILANAVAPGKDKKADNIPPEKKIQLRLKFQAGPIQCSLLNMLLGDENKLAMDAFVSIIRYAGDYPAMGQTQVDLARSVVCKGLQQSPNFRSEIYLQLMKQLLNNPQSSSEDKYWWLMKLMSFYFSPSPDFAVVHFRFLESFFAPTHPRYATAKEVEENLGLLSRVGPRKVFPSVEEVTFQQINRKLMVPVQLFCREPEQIVILPNTVTYNLTLQLVSKIGIEEERDTYTIYCALPNGGRKLFLPTDYLMDELLSLEEREKGKKNQTTTSLLNRKLMVRKCIWGREVSNSLPNDEMAFMVSQYLSDIQEGFYLPETTDFVKMIALDLVAKKSDYTKQSDERKTEILQGYLSQFALSRQSLAAWRKGVEAQVNAIGALEPRVAYKQLLTFIAPTPFYGAAFFRLTNTKLDKSNLPANTVFAVCIDMVVVLDAEKRTQLITWKYSDLIGWSAGEDRMNLKVGGVRSQLNFRGVTAQVNDLFFVLGEYSQRFFFVMNGGDLNAMGAGAMGADDGNNYPIMIPE